jgi:hypothetical protein
MFAKACYRHLKERLLDALDQVQKNREETQTLFFVKHFAVFFRYTCVHFPKAFQRLFDFILTLRKQNPVVLDLAKHLFNFLKHIKLPKELKDFAVLIL